MDDLNEMLNELRIEDFIWITFIFLSVFAIISNHFERKYDINHITKDKQIFRNINTTIFSITFIIYLYFVHLNFKRIKELNPESSPKQILTANANFIAASLFLIAGSIYLLTSIFGDSEANVFSIFS